MSEPLLISGMRRHPSGTVVHYPEPPIGKCGTSTRGFLAEVDEWLAEEREAGAAEVRARVEAAVDRRCLRLPCHGLGAALLADLNGGE